MYGYARQHSTSSLVCVAAIANTHVLALHSSDYLFGPHIRSSKLNEKKKKFLSVEKSVFILQLHGKIELKVFFGDQSD